MDAAELKKLQESNTAQALLIEAQNKSIAALNARAVRGDAADLARVVLSTTALTEAQRQYVTESVIGTADAPREIATKEGALDSVKFTEAINAEVKRFASALPPGGVRGMGAPGPQRVAESAEVIAAREARHKESAAADVQALVSLGLSEADAKKQVGVAA